MTFSERRKRNYRVGAAAAGAGVLVTMGVITAGMSSAPSAISEPRTTPQTSTATKATPSVTASTSEGAWPSTSTVKPSP
ncbi:MAG: hypothetical protein QOH60_3144 [Mycobacterium sp.]|nr:hypothetical protein [Mycobacterium sp.]